MSGPVLHTLFELCADVHRTRAFYSDVIGLAETFFDADKGWLTYQAGAIQLVFTLPEQAPPQVPGWSRSPSWDGGTTDHPSWVLEVSEEQLSRVERAASDAGIETQRRSSEDGSVQQVYLRDPLGRMVEVFVERERETLP